MPTKTNTIMITVIFFSLFLTVWGTFAAESDKIVSPTVKPNRLIHEKSPYLLQHAYNPVDWYPWGDEAFEKAHREERPDLDKIYILLKSGRSFYNPVKIVLLVDNAATRKMLADNLPFIAFIKTVNGKAAAYVCSDRSCSLPVTDPGALMKMLESAPPQAGDARHPAKAVPLSKGQ